MSLSGRDIVCLGFGEWDAELWTNQQHLMARLARHNRVLFVESLGLRQPSLAGKDLRRMARRAGRAVSGARAVDGLHVQSPLVVPIHGRARIRTLNARLLRAQVAHTVKALGFELSATLTPNKLLLGRLPGDRLNALIELSWVRRVEPPRFE